MPASSNVQAELACRHGWHGWPSSHLMRRRLERDEQQSSRGARRVLLTCIDRTLWHVGPTGVSTGHCGWRRQERMTDLLSLNLRSFSSCVCVGSSLSCSSSLGTGGIRAMGLGSKQVDEQRRSVSSRALFAPHSKAKPPVYGLTVLSPGVSTSGTSEWQGQGRRGREGRGGFEEDKSMEPSTRAQQVL